MTEIDVPPQDGRTTPHLACGTCNRQMPNHSTFCPWCGSRRRRCPTCRFAIEQRAWQYCIECGGDLVEQPEIDAPKVRFDHVVMWAEVEGEWLCTSHARGNCDRCPPRPVLAARRPDQVGWRRVDGRWHCETHSKVACGSCLNRSGRLFDSEDDIGVSWTFKGAWRCDTHDRDDCEDCDALGYFLREKPSFRWRDGERRCLLHNQVECRVCPGDRLDETLGTQLVDDAEAAFPPIRVAARRAGEAAKNQK